RPTRAGRHRGRRGHATARARRHRSARVRCAQPADVRVGECARLSDLRAVAADGASARPCDCTRTRRAEAWPAVARQSRPAANVEPRDAPRMTRQTLADRFVNYGDAVVAFGMVNALAFLIALSDREVRCTLPPGGAFFILIFPVTASILSAGLFACRRAEMRLRGGETLESTVSRYLQY